MSDALAPAAPPAPPSNVQEARTQLAALVADKERGAKLFAGDVETNRQFSQLTAIASRDDDSTVAAAMAGKLGDMPDSTARIMAGTADMLREIGIKEAIIEQVLQGHEVTAEEYKLTEAWKARQMKDPVFVKAYLSGEVEPREKMTLANIILSGGIKGQSGA
jgi:hypothetical protein